MDADGSSKIIRPGRRPTKKLKFKPKVPPQKPKKLAAEKPQEEESKPIDEELMKILRTRQVAENTSGNTKDERLTQNSPATPPSAAVVSLSLPQSGAHKQNQLQQKALQIPSVFPTSVNQGLLYKDDDDDDDDDDEDDDVEFQEAQLSSTECEASIRPAEELDLLEQDSKERMFLFQLPKSLPLPRRPSVVEWKGTATGKEAKEGSNLQQLPQGHLGKMLVYKSGKIKMKLGDVTFDVNPGAECRMAQHAVALNTREKHCCLLGEIENRHVIVTPNVDSLLNDN
ncbi:hypothetical protein ACP70R_036302 [Stipagrostis hirtigluma subsp. patula]